MQNVTPHVGTQPRALLKLDNQQYSLVSYSLQLNSHGASDSASIIVPMSSMPDLSGMFKDRSTPIEIGLYAGFPTNPQTYFYTDLSERFYGIVDSFLTTPKENRLEIKCRSFAAALLAGKHTSNFQNQTTTDVVNQIAGTQNLKPNIVLRPGQTGTPMNTVFGREFIVGVRNMRQWDILKACAQIDQVDLWVQGNVLNYCAPEVIQRGKMALHYGENVKDITISHSPFFSSNIEVEVRSWKPRVKTSYTTHIDKNGQITHSVRQVTSNPTFGTNASSSTSFISSTSSDGTVSNGTSSSVSTSSGGAANSGFTRIASDSTKEKYIFYIPNLDHDQCDQRAMAIWKEISQFEFVADFEYAIDEGNLTYTDIKTLFDLQYYPWPTYNCMYRPRRLTETFDRSSGWYARIEAVNHDLPDGEV